MCFDTGVEKTKEVRERGVETKNTRAREREREGDKITRIGWLNPFDRGRESGGVERRKKKLRKREKRSEDERRRAM